MPENDIKKVVVVDAPSELVYRAISEEDELKKWWVDVPVLEKKMDGKMLFQFLKENSEMLTEDFVVEGKIMEFIPNRKLSYTWKPVDDESYPDSLVSWTLEDISENKTKLTLDHTGLDGAKDASHLDEGWSYFLNKLVGLFK
jgi:uncharacterized protein YndB with AHSA1/START domain